MARPQPSVRNPRPFSVALGSKGPTACPLHCHPKGSSPQVSLLGCPTQHLGHHLFLSAAWALSRWPGGLTPAPQAAVKCLLLSPASPPWLSAPRRQALGPGLFRSAAWKPGDLGPAAVADPEESPPLPASTSHLSNGLITFGEATTLHSEPSQHTLTTVLTCPSMGN